MILLWQSISMGIYLLCMSCEKRKNYFLTGRATHIFVQFYNGISEFFCKAWLAEPLKNDSWQFMCLLSVSGWGSTRQNWVHSIIGIYTHNFLAEKRRTHNKRGEKRRRNLVLNLFMQCAVWFWRWCGKRKEFIRSCSQAQTVQRLLHKGGQ